MCIYCDIVCIIIFIVKALKCLLKIMLYDYPEYCIEYIPQAPMHRISCRSIYTVYAIYIPDMKVPHAGQIASYRPWALTRDTTIVSKHYGAVKINGLHIIIV
jgi:hypothetical protein